MTNPEMMSFLFYDSPVSDCCRVPDAFDELVKEFDESGEPSAEVRFDREMSSSDAEEFEEAILYTGVNVGVVFDEPYGRLWLGRLD